MLTPYNRPDSGPPGSGHQGSGHQGSDDELLNDLLDSRLAPAQSRALEARFEHEPALREAYDELLRTRELFRAAPDPAPPADFTARVRARLEAEAAAAPPPASLAAQREQVAELAPEVPRVWRRLMLAAYAAAALLMVGIGLISLRRGSQGENASGGAAPIETAGRKAERLEAQGLETAEVERVADKKDAGGASRESRARLNDGVDAEGIPVLGPAVAQGKSAAGDGSGEPFAPVGEGARSAPRLGPGGSVRPGLRVPSDDAPTVPLPSAGLPSAGLPSAGVPSDGLLPERVLDEPVWNVLLLEARTAAEGRALVAQVLAGPSARASEADEAERGFQRVLLRRADVRADAALLLRLRVSAPAAAAPQADPRPPEKERAAPLAVAPPAVEPPAAAPAAPAAPAPAAPAPSAPAATVPPPTTPAAPGPAPTPAASAAAPSPTVLADFWQDLSADQQARLEALLGPLPAAGVAPSGGGSGAAPRPAASLPRRVRIVITAAR